MCIRDSNHIDQLGDKKYDTIVGTLDFTMMFIPIEPAYIIAVSYTHLRAHETVLDLVCRLLLEKKKY